MENVIPLSIWTSFFTFVVCFDKMVRGRQSLAPDDELVNKTNVKKKLKSKVE